MGSFLRWQCHVELALSSHDLTLGVDEACKSVVTSLMGLEQRETLCIRLTIEHYCLQFLRVQLDCPGFA